MWIGMQRRWKWRRRGGGGGWGRGRWKRCRGGGGGSHVDRWCRWNWLNGGWWLNVQWISINSDTETSQEDEGNQWKRKSGHHGHNFHWRLVIKGAFALNTKAASGLFFWYTGYLFHRPAIVFAWATVSCPCHLDTSHFTVTSSSSSSCSQLTNATVKTDETTVKSVCKWINEILPTCYKNTWQLCQVWKETCTLQIIRMIVMNDK